jgi:hypothetical protein
MRPAARFAASQTSRVEPPACEALRHFSFSQQGADAPRGLFADRFFWSP